MAPFLEAGQGCAVNLQGRAVNLQWRPVDLQGRAVNLQRRAMDLQRCALGLHRGTNHFGDFRLRDDSLLASAAVADERLFVD